MNKLAAMHPAAACATQKKYYLPAQKLCDKRAAHAKPHPAEFWGGLRDPGGQPTGFEDPCRTLIRNRVSTFCPQND